MEKQRTMNKKLVGLDGENLACSYLRRKGYKIITRNYRCRIGEIDIVARHKKTLIFCEVKTRNNKDFGEPFEAVTKFKQDRLRRLAECYLRSVHYDQKFPKDFNFRFDVISIIFGQNNDSEITHLENAF
jgi:putative endonuclease